MKKREKTKKRRMIIIVKTTSRTKATIMDSNNNYEIIKILTKTGVILRSHSSTHVLPSREYEHCILFTRVLCENTWPSRLHELSKKNQAVSILLRHFLSKWVTLRWPGSKLIVVDENHLLHERNSQNVALDVIYICSLLSVFFYAWLLCKTRVLETPQGIFWGLGVIRKYFSGYMAWLSLLSLSISLLLFCYHYFIIMSTIIIITIITNIVIIINIMNIVIIVIIITVIVTLNKQCFVHITYPAD